jgi:hypothetical protein
VNQALPEEDRLRLVKFVCAMAWSDFEVHAEERDHIMRLIGRLDLPESAAERARVWLSDPNTVREIDPSTIPREQRNLFFSEAGRIMLVDGVLREEEAETLDVLRRLLFPEDDVDE